MVHSGIGHERVGWVDYAKGFCIVMVVMMHSTLGVAEVMGDTGWMGALVAFAQPFRMPDFFLISGLFLARVIDRPWRDYLDRKLVHFAYFYVLWVSIQFAFKAPGFAAEGGWTHVGQMYLLAFVQPFGTLWFIYLLPVFFVAAKLLRPLPVWLVWALAAGLEIAPIATGWVIVDETAARFVYFYSGYVLAGPIFALAAEAARRWGLALAGLAAWALVNGAFVAAGLSALPGIGLALGFLGAGAVVAFSALLARLAWAAPLRHAGQHSIVVYLAFFLPMAVTRIAIDRFALVEDAALAALIVTGVAAVSPLVGYALVRGTPLRFLFERPAWARLRPSAPRPSAVPAE